MLDLFPMHEEFRGREVRVFSDTLHEGTDYHFGIVCKIKDVYQAGILVVWNDIEYFFTWQSIRMIQFMK